MDETRFFDLADHAGMEGTGWSGEELIGRFGGCGIQVWQEFQQSHYCCGEWQPTSRKDGGP